MSRGAFSKGTFLHLTNILSKAHLVSWGVLVVIAKYQRLISLFRTEVIYLLSLGTGMSKCMVLVSGEGFLLHHRIA